MINGMSVADINEVAKSQLKPENMIIIVVGHAYKVRDGLNDLGYGKIVEMEVN
jgi:predicted Zn-dependent peptidase